jgi:hypothetical protein
MQTVSTINDFGQKIGGAKKDLARESIERIKLITDDVLINQPLSKSFPRPDFAKMFRDNLIAEETAIRLLYLYNRIEAKPRKSYRLNRWAATTMNIINLIRDILDDENAAVSCNHFASSGYDLHRREMICAEWLTKDYNPYPYKIEDGRYAGVECIVTKGQYIRKKGSVEECVKWVLENTGENKPAASPQYSIYKYRSTGEVFITPAGKKDIILIRGLKTFEEARDYVDKRPEDLKKSYDTLRFIPEERNNWNRPRIGQDYRTGKDISPETFASVFPFRGVEFGNWVNQVERAASLNEAYDALSDLAAVLSINKSIISLDGKLALAFGARGSGNASAHYERTKVVINLTKTRGAGSLAHEWFHALDNYICICQGSPLSFATEKPLNIRDKKISDALLALCTAIKRSDYYRRSAEIDKLKTKKYWATMPELTARAFEKHIICKLKESGHENDYLANIVSFENHARPEVYPYPTDEEIKILSPLYDIFMASLINLELLAQRKQVA